MALRSTSITNYATGSTVAVPVPTGAASGDIVVVDVWLESTSVTPTGPAGFTLEASKTITASPANVSLHRFWKRLTGSDTGTYSFTLSAPLNYSAVAAAMTGRASSGSPFGTGGAATATAGSSPGFTTPPAISAASAAAGADALLGISGYDYGDDPTITVTGFTRAVANGDSVYLFTAANISSGAPGSITPAGPSDGYVEILSIMPLDTGGGSSFAASRPRIVNQALTRAAYY